MINYYVVLEIPNFSDETVIKKAYRTLSKKYHPDVNKDPNATDYFQKINEAYSFLMIENKRFLLDQFLKTVGNRPYQSSKKREDVHYQPPSKPVIHFFSTDKKTFTLGDYILVQWNVSQCKAVHLNILGSVDFSGTHYLRVEQFMKEIIILMTIIGLDNKEYKYRIRLKYYNENPTIEAFHQVQSEYPNVSIEHFKKEKFFSSFGRISKSTFKNRMILLFSLLAVSIFIYISTTYKFIVFVGICFIFWLIYLQSYKRIHDIKHLKTFAYRLWVPFYNLLLFRELFLYSSENKPSEFGMMPSQNQRSFISWLLHGFKNHLRPLNLIEKVSAGTFLLVLGLILFKFLWSYEEHPVTLTSNYVETSRPTSSGQVYKDYFLVFDRTITVKVSENDFYNLIKQRQNNRFLLATNRKGEAQYINVINKNEGIKNRLNVGVLSDSSPILLILIFVVLLQFYAWRTLKKPEEKPYSNAFMVVALMVYLYMLSIFL